MYSEDPLIARARRFGHDLLAFSASYDDGLAIPYGDPTALCLVGLALRSRRLVRGIYRLADDGDWLEAQILLRALLEYSLTAQWIGQDPRPRFLSWWLEDDKRFRTMEREVQALIEHPVEVPEDLRQGREELASQFAAEAKKLNAPKFPRLQQMAKAVGGSLGYSFVYRVQSQVGAHPYPHGLDSLIEDRPVNGGVFLRPDPVGRPAVEPYYFAAALLFMALREAGRAFPPVDLGNDSGRFESELRAIRDLLDEPANGHQSA
jgi:hypothetical protein